MSIDSLDRLSSTSSLRFSPGNAPPTPHTESSDSLRLVKEPLVSVVLITYNHERYLGEAIEGVLRQTADFPIELLIGEDCSTDATREVALHYQKQFPEMIRVITAERNVGMHENVTRLVRAARGKYIAFCEGDDCWCRSDKLNLQISVLESDPTISLVCTNYQVISDNGAVINPSAMSNDNSYQHYMKLDDILLGRIRTLTVCARAEATKWAISESPFCRPGRYPFGDHPLWVELSRRGRCCYLPQICGSYRMSLHSATRPGDPMKTYRFLAAMSEFERDVVDLYSLPQGEEAAINLKITATRRRFRSLALLGESTGAKAELEKMKELGTNIGFKERFMYLISTVVHPGTLGATALIWSIHAWRAVRYGILPKWR